MNLLRTIQFYREFFYPVNTLDNEPKSRLKLGLMRYAQLDNWWVTPRIQRWIKRRTLTFRIRGHSRDYYLKVLGGDHSHLWAAAEVFLDRTYDLSLVPFIPELILDLGANIGCFSLLAGGRWPDTALVCVEPHPMTFSLLAMNLEHNGINGTKLQCAIDAEVALKYLEGEPVNGAICQHLADSGETGTRILTIPLHALLPDNPDVKLLIKLDIEGAETGVLEGLKTCLPHNCFIFIELHDGDQSLDWVHSYADKNGFNFVQGRRLGDAIDGRLTRRN